MTIVSAQNTSIDVKNNNGTTKEQSILIIQGSIASLGIVTNLTVIVVFFNHKKLRLKIPNIFIINQVRMKNISRFRKQTFRLDLLSETWQI